MFGSKVPQKLSPFFCSVDLPGAKNQEVDTNDDGDSFHKLFARAAWPMKKWK